LATLLEALGIEHDRLKPANGGADVGQMRKIGLPVIDLNQDASRYFDWHHTANDTLDKVDPADLRQNVAAWVTLVWAVTRTGTEFGPVPAFE
jgi:Zn-dependent M28 family amino/carboxypeptidase